MVLNPLKIDSIKDVIVADLSGGQLQRLAITICMGTPARRGGEAEDGALRGASRACARSGCSAIDVDGCSQDSNSFSPKFPVTFPAMSRTFPGKLTEISSRKILLTGLINAVKVYSWERFFRANDRIDSLLRSRECQPSACLEDLS